MDGETCVVDIGKRVGPGVFCGTIAACNATVRVHIPVTHDEIFGKASRATLCGLQLSWQDSHVNLHVDPVKDGAYFLHPSLNRGPFRVVELFGGLGGWSHGCRDMGTTPIAVIDNNRDVCEACAKALKTQVIDGIEFYRKVLKSDPVDIQTMVVCADVTHKIVWMAISMLNTKIGRAHV